MSLRKSLFISLAVMVTVIGITTALVSYWIAGDEANDFFDNQLRQVAIYVWQAPAKPDEPPVPPLDHDPEDDFVIQIWDRDGHVIVNSNPDAAIPQAATAGFSDFTGGGISWRIYNVASPERTVQVAQQLVVRDELAATASLQAALPIALSIPLSWVMLNWIIGKVIGRLHRVAATVREREAERVDVIPNTEVPSEILPLVTTVNGLVQRLQIALDQQRRFVSDAAHELRTPLAAISIQAANLRSTYKDATLFAARLTDLEAGIARTAALVNQLLKLARYESAPVTRVDPTTDLTSLIVGCFERFAPVAEERSIDLGLAGPDAALVIGVEEDVRVLLDNILDNAIKYSPIGSAVDFTIHQDGSTVTLDIRDGGPGIDDAHLPRVYEPFFRASGPDVEGSGLGLSIAKAAADRNGIRLSLFNRGDASGLNVRLTFARATAA